MNMKSTRVLPPVYLFISLATMVLFHLLIPVSKIAPYPWNLLGAIPLAMGIALNLIADAALKKVQTTVKPFEESTALITIGAYRISRHPMYLGMVLILLGIAFLMGSLTPFVVIAIFGILMELVFVKAEERMLEDKFGGVWVTYRNKVRQWL